jgi:hypothetical protein
MKERIEIYAREWVKNLILRGIDYPPFDKMNERQKERFLDAAACILTSDEFFKTQRQADVRDLILIKGELGEK